MSESPHQNPTSAHPPLAPHNSLPLLFPAEHAKNRGEPENAPISRVEAAPERLRETLGAATRWPFRAGRGAFSNQLTTYYSNSMSRKIRYGMVGGGRGAFI